jgi:TP901 family phage tail tape measure protein
MAGRSVWELFLKDSISKGLNPLNGAADKLSNAFGNAQDRINKTQNALAGAANEIPAVSRGVDMLNNSSVLLGASIMAVGAGLYKATSLAYDYDLGMAKINATAQLGDESLGRLKDRLKDIGSHSGGNFEKVPEAYEKILSQTGKVNLSLDILETSVKGAKAGFTDIDVVAGALAQTLSVVGEHNTTAQEVMDTLLMAKGVGAGEFKDFAQYMPQLIASGANMNIAFKDTAGLFSYMTAKGQSAADSAMLMQNAFTALQKNDVMKGLKSKGVDLFDAKGMRRNIKDVFLDISDKMKGLSDKQKSAFFIDIGLNDAQAKNAFSVLTSDGEKFKSIMDSVNNALGETDRQLNSTANSARTWGDTWDEIKNWGESIGSYILPIIDELVQGISFTASMIKDLFTTGKIHDTDKMSAFQNEANDASARNAAGQDTAEKFGGKTKDAQGNFTKEAKAFFDQRYKDILSGMAGEKNHIVDEKGTVMKDAFGKAGHSTTGASVNSKLQSSIDGVSGGGKSVRNVNVTIHKMVEQLIVKAGTVQESAIEIERKMEEYLLRAIQGSEIALSND